MLAFDEAMEKILTNIWPLPSVELPLQSCAGLVLARRMDATGDVPAFTNSAMDGFAVRSQDTSHAPVRLRVMEEIPAGHVPTHALSSGEASRIMTGAPLPEGADAVLMLERAVDEAGVVLVTEPVRMGEHVRQRGEELREGQALLEQGTLLRPFELALLASHGQVSPSVVPRPKVTIIATGDELVAPEYIPSQGQVRESNSIALAALAESCGAMPSFLGMVEDDAGALAEAIRGASGSDLLLLSAGISAGKHDVVMAAVEQLDGDILFRKVAMKPGKPVTFGRVCGMPFFALPGNPVSAMACFILLARPALLRMRGLPPQEEFRATLASAVEIPAERTTFLTGVLRSGMHGLEADPLAEQGSARLTSLTGANCLIRIEPGCGKLDAGEIVRVVPLGGMP